jgi:hypothetical protein
VNKTHIRLKFVGRALRVALCYVVAFQALFTAYSIAGAADDAGGTVAGFIICHSAGDDATPRPDSGNVPKVHCALCAMATSAGGLLPPATSVVAAQLAVSHRLRVPDIVVARAPSAIRAGLARAPPNVV